MFPRSDGSHMLTGDGSVCLQFKRSKSPQLCGKPDSRSESAFTTDSDSRVLSAGTIRKGLAHHQAHPVYSWGQRATARLMPAFPTGPFASCVSLALHLLSE